MPPRNQEKVRIEWSPNFAYAIGLIASDGCLHKNKIHIKFTSKELELIEKFKIALNIKNKVNSYTTSDENIRTFYNVTFGDKVFYSFLNTIGLTSAKSKSIKSVDIPNKLFSDFLRGLFDGDGTFYTFWDKRWPNSFCFRMAFASASPDFINWLKKRLAQLYKTKGCLHKGAGVINLEYVKGDSKKLFDAMYYTDNLLFLNRKYIKIKNAFKKDKKVGKMYLQKQRDAAVAQPGRAVA